MISVDQPATEGAAVDGQGCLLNRQLRLPVHLLGPFEGRHRRQSDHPTDVRADSCFHQLASALYVHLPDVCSPGQGEVVGAVHQRVSALEDAGLVSPAQAIRNGCGVRRSRGPHQGAYRKPGGLEGSADDAAEVAVAARHGDCPRPRTRAGGHQASASAPVAIRCALAMIVRVNVVAGTSGNTDASTRCTRRHRSVRPRVSVEVLDARVLCGKLEPQ